MADKYTKKKLIRQGLPAVKNNKLKLHHINNAYNYSKYTTKYR